MSMVYCRGCGKQLHETAEICPSCGAPQFTVGDKNRIVAALLALFLGSFGIHRFYLRQWWGIFYLLLCWTGIPALVALIEALVFLFSDQRQWDDKYNAGVPSGTGRGRFIILAGILVFICITVIGILFAIAVPGRQDYTVRAQATEAVGIAAPYKIALAEYYANSHDFSGVDISDLQVQVSGTYVDSIRLEQAHGSTIVITATYKQSGISGELAGKNLTLATVDGGHTWMCGYQIKDPALRGEGLVKPKYLPSSCK